MKLYVRLRAIGYCLWFGLLPWQVYEDTCHYEGMTYKGHALMNVKIMLRWLTPKPPDHYWKFEREVNNNY